MPSQHCTASWRAKNTWHRRDIIRVSMNSNHLDGSRMFFSCIVIVLCSVMIGSIINLRRLSGLVSDGIDIPGAAMPPCWTSSGFDPAIPQTCSATVQHPRILVVLPVGSTFLLCEVILLDSRNRTIYQQHRSSRGQCLFCAALPPDKLGTVNVYPVRVAPSMCTGSSNDIATVSYLLFADVKYPQVVTYSALNRSGDSICSLNGTSIR